MSYLKQLANLFAREEGDRLSQYIFVFPNRRAGLFFRRDLGLALGHPVISPTVITINECFYRLTDTRLADPIDLLLRVARIHNDIREEQHLDPEPLDKFLFWGKMILSDFNEVDNHLVPDVKKFFDNIRELHTIDSHFNSRSEATSHSSPLGAGWEGTIPLYDIYSRLHAELKAEGLAYDGMLHREVIERLNSKLSDETASLNSETTLNSKHSTLNYIFIGFNALTASEEQLMLYFKNQGQADFYFDYSDPLVSDKTNRASLFMEHNQELFPSKYQLSTIPQGVNSETTLNSKHSTLNYIEVNSTVAEAQEVHRILTELTHSSEGSTSLERTAVVLPDERLLIPLLHTLPEAIDKVNVTMGYPLSATPTYALISLIVDLQERMTEDGFYHKDVTAILSHPYVHRLSPEACDAIKQDINQRNRIYLDETAFAKDEYLKSIFSKEPDVWRDILNHLPEDASEAVYRVQTVLNRIDKYFNSFNSKTTLNSKRSQRVSILNSLLNAETIPYIGEPLEGLQIMGILETRALDFDNIILTGFNDDLYPGNSITNSFIPYEVRCQYGLPTAQRKDAIFAYNFYRMIGYAKQIWFIANTRADEQHSGEPSRYLYQLLYQFGKDINHIVVTENLSATLNSELQAEGRNRTASPNSKHSTLNSYSPSGLNTYLRCPRQYYWQYICGIREPEQVKEDIDPRELGTELHKLLQNFYEPFCGKTVQKEDIAAMLRRLPADDSPLPMLLREYAGLILEHDKELAPFTYIATEQPRQIDLTLEDGSVVTLKGTIDRVDSPYTGPKGAPLRPEGRYSPIRIVDYKTGGAKLEFASVASLFDPEDDKRNPYALQTILYAILYGCGDTGCSCNSDCSGNAGHIVIEPHIYGVRLLAQGPDTAVHANGQENVNTEEITEAFLGHLKKLIAEIRDPQNEFTYTVQARNCESCAFAALCTNR